MDTVELGVRGLASSPSRVARTERARGEIFLAHFFSDPEGVLAALGCTSAAICDEFEDCGECPAADGARGAMLAEVEQVATQALHWVAGCRLPQERGLVGSVRAEVERVEWPGGARLLDALDAIRVWE